jgi:MYXO-CTERM domain-containing protein
MVSSLRLVPLALLASLALPGLAFAGTITTQGNVSALTNVNQLQGIVGTATYDEGAANQGVPLGQYTPMGMTFYTGLLVNILAGVNTGGSASQPLYQTGNNYFPAPIAGGGIAQNAFTYFGGAVKFSQPVTQFGLTASRNGTQYITVWNTNGQMIGQVTWQPNNDAAFVGIDTNGVPIGMLTYGNDNLWAGGSFDIGGSTIISDHWIWALGVPCQSDADCMDDNNPCTATQCSNGACLYPADPQGICPDDGNLCTTDECQNGACIHWDNNDPCDDADACTDFDTCDNGECNGVDIECNDANLCSVDSCDSMIGCVNEFQPGCCLSDEDCPDGQICLLGSNSCIPDPNPDTGSDTSTDTTSEGTTDTTSESTSDPGDTTSESTSEGGDTSESSSGNGESVGEGESAGEGNDELGGLDTFGGVEPEDGCGCTTDQRGGGALASLFGLALLAGVRRRRDPQ